MKPTTSIPIKNNECALTTQIASIGPCAGINLCSMPKHSEHNYDYSIMNIQALNWNEGELFKYMIMYTINSH